MNNNGGMYWNSFARVVCSIMKKKAATHASTAMTPIGDDISGAAFSIRGRLEG